MSNRSRGNNTELKVQLADALKDYPVVNNYVEEGYSSRKLIFLTQSANLIAAMGARNPPTKMEATEWLSFLNHGLDINSSTVKEVLNNMHRFQTYLTFRTKIAYGSAIDAQDMNGLLHTYSDTQNPQGKLVFDLYNCDPGRSNKYLLRPYETEEHVKKKDRFTTELNSYPTKEVVEPELLKYHGETLDFQEGTVRALYDAVSAIGYELQVRDVIDVLKFYGNQEKPVPMESVLVRWLEASKELGVSGYAGIIPEDSLPVLKVCAAEKTEFVCKLKAIEDCGMVRTLIGNNAECYPNDNFIVAGVSKTLAQNLITGYMLVNNLPPDPKNSSVRNDVPAQEHNAGVKRLLNENLPTVIKNTMRLQQGRPLVVKAVRYVELY